MNLNPKGASEIADKAAARLPADAAARKRIPIARGVMDYFPAALAAVAEVSVIGNEQHNPGEPLHWARSKSTDHADCIARHLIERGTVDVDGARHSAKLAWRALALLQTELEEEAARVEKVKKLMQTPAPWEKPEPRAQEFDPKAVLRGEYPYRGAPRVTAAEIQSWHTEPVQIGGAVHMMPTPPTYVLAGNFRQFSDYIAQRPGKFVYADHPDKLRGTLNPKIVTTGTWWENHEMGRFLTEQGLWMLVNR